MYDFFRSFHTIMPAAATPRLTSGRVYRTKDLARWGRNPTRLANRLVREGELVRLRHGLFFRPKLGRYGPVPPEDHELMRGFLEGGRFVFSGPSRWNALGLGSTAVFASQLVYNTKRSGEFRFGKRLFVLRRVKFPKSPTPEWFAVDLLENREMVGLALNELERKLTRAVRKGGLGAEELRAAAKEYGTQQTQATVDRAVGTAVA